MPDMMITPFDRHFDDVPTLYDAAEEASPAADMLIMAARLGADICYVVFTTCTFIISTLLMALGVPLILLFIGSGNDVSVMAENVGNIADHFLVADPESQQLFADKLKWLFLGTALLLHVVRMPGWLSRFWAGLDRDDRP